IQRSPAEPHDPPACRDLLPWPPRASRARTLHAGYAHDDRVAHKGVHAIARAIHSQIVANSNPFARSSGMSRAVASTVWRWSLSGDDSSPSWSTTISPLDTRSRTRLTTESAVRARNQFQSHNIQLHPTMR